MFLEIFATLFILFVFWFLPAAALAYIVKKIVKRKISKGWCILLFFVSSIISFTLLLILNAHWENFGTIWKFLALILTWEAISLVLYDNQIPSIFDTEKELKAKNNFSKNK